MAGCDRHGGMRQTWRDATDMAGCDRQRQTWAGYDRQRQTWAGYDRHGGRAPLRRFRPPAALSTHGCEEQHSTYGATRIEVKSAPNSKPTFYMSVALKLGSVPSLGNVIHCAVCRVRCITSSELLSVSRSSVLIQRTPEYIANPSGVDDCGSTSAYPWGSGEGTFAACVEFLAFWPC
jgi:hypothetical protein